MPAHRTGSASQRGTSVAEVNLRRLLAKCDATLVGGGGNPGRDTPLTAPPLPPELASAAASSASALSADGSREPAGGTLDGVPPRAAPPLPHANAVAAPGSDDPFPPGQVSAGASSPPSPHQPDAAVLRRRAALDRNKFATNIKYLSKLLADVEAEDQALGASLLLQFNGLARLGKNAPAGVGVVDALADTSRSRGWFNTPTSMAIVRAAERAALVEYRRKIAVLFDLMNELKLTAPVEKCLSQTRLARSSQQTQKEKNQENEKELIMIRKAEDQLKSELLQESRANSESTGLRDSIMTWSLEEKKNELFRIDRAVSSSLNMISEEGLRERSMNNGANGDEPGAENQQLLLDHHQHLQEKLSQDLLGMAAVLKQNSLVFGQVLKRDEQTITNAQSLLEGNLNRLRSTRGRLQVYSQKAGKTTLFVWAVVLFVCSASVLVYLFIRIFPKLRSF